MRGADEQVLRQPLDRADVILRHHHPADAPPRHAEILAERIHHIDVIAQFQRRHGARAMMQPVIDLVRHEPQAPVARKAHQIAQRVPAQHRPRRIARRGYDQPLQVQPGEIGRNRLQPVLRPRLNADRHQRQRLQDLTIAWIAGLAQPHPVARIEKGRERQHERPRRPRRDHDTARVQIDPVPAPVQRRDPRPQRRQAQRHRIAQRRALQVLRQCGAGPGRGGRCGLAHLHMDDVPPRRLGPLRGLDHIHHDEGINRAPA